MKLKVLGSLPAPHKFLLSAVYIILLTNLCGCQSLVRGNAAPDSGFIEDADKMEKLDNFILDAWWISDTLRENHASYKKILVAPINTEFLGRTGDWAHIKTRSDEQIKEDIKELAQYYQNALKEAFAAGRVPQLTLAEEAGPDTLIVEIAIVELIPTDVVRNAAGNVAGFFVPGGGMVAAGAGGRIATEGRLRDAESNEVLFKAKAHKVDKIAPVDLAGLTHYGHAKQNLDDWVDEIVKILNKPFSTDINETPAVTLSPW